MYIRPRGKDLHCATPEEWVQLLLAYFELLTARWTARDQNLPRSASARSVSYFRSAGFADHLLLWMFYQGHVEPVQPPTAQPTGSGAPAATDLLLWTPSCSFALTDDGERFADQFLCDVFFPDTPEQSQAAWDLLLVGRLLPCYEVDDRLFCWGRHVMKHFVQPAVNQEVVLSAAEELAWAAWFDDPLPRRAGKNPKVRLHDTIKDLNRRQRLPVIQFRGNGTGTRVGWQYSWESQRSRAPGDRFPQGPDNQE